VQDWEFHYSDSRDHFTLGLCYSFLLSRSLFSIRILRHSKPHNGPLTVLPVRAHACIGAFPSRFCLVDSSPFQN